MHLKASVGILVKHSRIKNKLGPKSFKGFINFKDLMEKPFLKVSEAKEWS